MPPSITSNEHKDRQSRVLKKSTLEGLKLPKLPDKTADRKPVVQKKMAKPELKVPKLKSQPTSTCNVPCPPIKGATITPKQASALKSTTVPKLPKTPAANVKTKDRDTTPKRKESGRGRSREPHPAVLAKPKKQPRNDSKRGKSKEPESTTSGKPSKQTAKTEKAVVEDKTLAKPSKQAKNAKAVVGTKTSAKPSEQPKNARAVVEAKTAAKPSKQPKNAKAVVKAETSAKPSKQPKNAKAVVKAETSAKPSKQPKAVIEAKAKGRQKTDKSPAKAIKKGKAETKLVNKDVVLTASKGITSKSPSHNTSRGLFDPHRPLPGEFVHPVAKGLDPILSENESLSSVSIGIDTPPPRRIAPMPVKSAPFNGRVSRCTPQYHTMSVLGVRQEMSPAKSISSPTPTELTLTPGSLGTYSRADRSVTPGWSVASEISSYSTKRQDTIPCEITLSPLPIEMKPRGRKGGESKPGRCEGTLNFLQVDKKSTSPTTGAPTNAPRMEYATSAMEMRTKEQMIASQQGNQKITRRVRPMGARIRPIEPIVIRIPSGQQERDGRINSGRSTAVSSVAGSLWNYSEESRSKDSRSICSSMAGYTPFSSETGTPGSTNGTYSRSDTPSTISGTCSRTGTPNSTYSGTSVTSTSSSSTLTDRRIYGGGSNSSVSTLRYDGEHK